MSSLVAESECRRDVSSMLPKWFKHTRSIKCGRKIICTDQLYGWRGSDTGYYGSEELEDVPDFLDEVKIPPVQIEMKNEQLEALRKEAEERIEKERKTHPNFNILTDRAPTPDFSITYIETSYNTDGESVNKSHKENVISATEAEKTAVDDSAGDQGNGFGEPMEVDNSSYFRHVTHHQNEDVCGAVDSILDNDKNLTYIMGKNGDNVNLLLPASEDRVSSSEECKPILQFKLDGTIIVEKLHEAEGGQTQNGEKDQHDVSLFSCNHTDETAKNTSPQREMLNKVMEVAEYQMLQTTNSITVHHDDGISPQSANQKVFACPAPLQATFDLSRIDKVDLSTGAKSEISQTSPVNQRVCRTSRPDLLKQIDSGITNLNIPRLNDQTVVSFKTPKQHVETVMKRTVVRKQPINATPLFKKKSVASTALRGTSTPVEGSACYVCPRYNAHHAALASHATQTGSGTPVSFHSRIMPANTLTPIRRPLANSSRFFCPPTAMKASTPRTPLLTNALTTISQYGTPPSLSKRNALVDYELTPQSHVLSKIRTPQQKCNGAKPENQSTSSVTQIPMSRFAFEHLKSGGTPRPTSNTEKKWKKITGDSSLSSVPKTPVAKADISQMLVDNVMRSGPAYRRRPHPSKLLLPIGKLQFEKSAENPDFSSKHTSPVTEIAKDSPLNAQEEMNTTQLVVIDSFDGDAVEKLCEDTASLSIVNEQNISSEEPKFIFDTTTSEYRKKQKTPVFDTGNYFGRRRILSMLNDSNVSVNTPGKKEDLVVKHDYVLNPSFSGDSRQPSDISASPVHIIAAKDENKHAAVLCARKIIHSEEEGQGLRRSTRNRVAPIRRWLGEKPVYRRDQQGTYELVRVEEAIVKDPLFVKYNTVDMAEVLERQKREQKQHARARKLRKFDRARRGYAEEDTKTSEPDDNSLHN